MIEIIEIEGKEYFIILKDEFNMRIKSAHQNGVMEQYKFMSEKYKLYGEI